MLNLSQGHHPMLYSVAWSPDGHQTTEHCNFLADFNNRVIRWKVPSEMSLWAHYTSHQETLMH